MWLYSGLRYWDIACTRWFYLTLSTEENYCRPRERGLIFIQWLLNQSWNYDIHLSLIYDEIVLTCNNDIVIVKNRYEVIKAQLFVNWIILQSGFFLSLAISKLLVDHRFNVSVCFDVCILYCNICVAFIISSLPLKRWPYVNQSLHYIVTVNVPV